MLQLKDGDKIAIIGAGPAGTFFARFAIQYAKQAGLKVSITIFDAKNFIQAGPAGCNMCAGVISANLLRLMREQGVFLPEGKVQRKIDGYYLQTIRYGFLLTREDIRSKITAVFRGNGPRFAQTGQNVSFDDYLLELAKQEGVAIIPELVKEIVLPSNPEDKVQLKYGEDRVFESDLVVGAFGLSRTMMEKAKNLGFGYMPPQTLNTLQVEIKLDPEVIKKYFGNNIYVFSLGIKGIRYASLIPKGEYITVSLVGKGNLKKADLNLFMQAPQVKAKFPPDFKMPTIICHCHPKIATSSPQQPFTDRLVIIGDAGYSRYYKNGLESAFVTAELAARTACKFGISKEAFQRVYLPQAKKLFAKDNFYGKLLYALHDFITSRDLLVEIHLLATAKSEALKKILWAMFTGDLPYRVIFFRALNPWLALKMLLTSLVVVGSRLVTFLTRAPRQVVEKVVVIRGRYLGPLYDGQRVVIVGGGPGGVACAIALKNLAKQTAIDLDVVIFEGKTFDESSPRYNQCIGVLSPPIRDILERRLGIPFPEDLSQRIIRGYILYSGQSQIKLEGEGEPSYALRRITFDRYMLNQAKKMGVEVVHSRVTDVEFGNSRVMVYAESTNVVADVVVGAFGLDDGGIKLFERATAYRSPRVLNSIVTKIHPGEEIVAAYKDYIHAFLPSPRDIEFGAVTPKRNHLTINIAGAHVTSSWMDRFLDFPQVKAVLPDNLCLLKQNLDYYKGRFPISLAKNFFGDRYVIIGDAAGMVRPFKGKGVNSACIAGIAAAETMMKVGISSKAFWGYYDRCHEVTKDLIYGKILRWLTIASTKFGLLDPIIKLAKQDKKLSMALFNCVSAHKSFKKIFEETVDLKLLAKILFRLIWRF